MVRVTSTRALFLAAGLSASVLGRVAFGQNFNEAEANDTKGSAQAIVFTNDVNGTVGTITGRTTGTSTSTAGDGSADYFLLTMPDAATDTVYAYSAVVTTAGTAGHTITLRGLSQSDGAINFSSDATFSTSSTTPDRRAQWYGFGKANEQVYIRVTGGTGTTSNYTVTLTRTAVTPITVSGPLSAGPVTVSSIGTTGTPNTDFWVYDSGFNALGDFGNDNENSTANGTTNANTSAATRTLPQGTYHVAISDRNLANSLPSPSDDRERDQNVLDFAGVVANGSTSTNVNVGFSISDGVLVKPVAATKAARYDVVFATFTVGPNNNITVSGAASVRPKPGETVRLTATVTPAEVMPNTITGVTVDLSQIGGSASAAMFDNGTNGDAVAGDNIWTLDYTVPVNATLGFFGLNFTASDNNGRTRTGVITVGVRPLNDECGNAVALTDAQLAATQSFSVIVAAAESDELIPCTSSQATDTHNGVWYSYVAPAERIVAMAELAGLPTSHQIRFAVYDDCGVFRACVSSDDDANFRLPAGSYKFLVAPFTTNPVTEPNRTLQWTITASPVPAAPANDACENAIDLTGQASLVQTFAIGGATPDVDNGCNSSSQSESFNGIWFKYTATDDIIVQMRETDSNTFGHFTAFAGCGGPEVSCRNLGGTSHTTMPLAGGQTYYILVSRNNQAPANGDFDLDIQISLNNLPGGSCARAVEVTSLPFVNTQNNAAAADFGTPSCVNRRALNALWYRYVPTHDVTVYFRDHTSQDAMIIIYTGACGSVTEYWCDPTFSQLADVTMSVKLLGGQTYYFLVARENISGSPAGSTEQLGLTIHDASIHLPVPANDACASATPIPAAPFDATVYHSAAGIDVKTACSAGTASVGSTSGVWYRYTNGPNAATASIYLTQPTDFPSGQQVAVYAGSCPTANMQEIVCDAERDVAEHVSFAMSPNTTYSILLAAENVLQGHADEFIQFHFDVAPNPAPPGNGACDTARAIGSVPYSDRVYSNNLAPGVDINCNSGTAVNNAVWYSYTHNGPNAYGVFREDGPQDAVIAAFTSCPATANSEVRCASSSDVGVIAVATGQTYYFMVGRFDTGVSAPQDYWDFRFEVVPEPANVSCAAATPIASFPSRVTLPNLSLTDSRNTGCNTTATSMVRQGAWFTFTARDNFVFMVDEVGPDNSTATALFSGPCDALTEVGCSSNETSGNDFDFVSPKIMAVRAGETYHLLVGRGTANAALPDRQFYDLVFFSFGSDMGACSVGNTCTVTSRANCAGTFTQGATACACPADFNGTGGVNVSDIFAFLSAWFAEAPGADFNHSGTIDVADIFAFLSAWFAGCP